MVREKICGYCRVSTKDKEQLSSFENQMSYFQREFGESDNYELVELYSDCGRSGTSLKRPGFDKMIADAGIDKSKMDGDLYLVTGKPKFTRILVKNTSRFARNVSADMLIKTLMHNGVHIDFIDTNLSTERAADIIVVQMLQVLDENDSRDKSRKVRFGIEEGIKRGNIHTHGNLYGYKYYPKPENRLEIIEEEAEVIRLIFDLYVNYNMGVHRIRQHLIEHGMFARSGKPFSERGLRVMIQNETYSGRAVRKKFTNGLIFNKHATKETGQAIIFETDKIPAIISIETFEKAQAVLESRVQHSTQKGIHKGKTLFAGKIICGCCGSTYYASSSDYIKSAGGRVRSYACSKKRTMHKDKDGNRVMLCNNCNVSETALNEFVYGISYVSSIYEKASFGSLALYSLSVALLSRINKQDVKAINELKQQLELVQEKKKKLLGLYLENSFSKEQLDAYLEPLDAEQIELGAKINSLSKSNDEIYADIKEIEESVSYLNTIKDKAEREIESGQFTATKEEIVADIEYITVREDGKLAVRYKAFEEIERLLDKHRHFIPIEKQIEFGIARKVS